MILIFIAGASGSGKTTLANMLVERLNQSGKTGRLLSMDDYYFEIPEGVDLHHFRNNTNFDRLEMCDQSLLINHLMALHNGQTITKPIFDFPTNRRLSTEIVSPPEFLVVEGLFALCIAKNLPISNDIAKLTVFTGTSSYLGLINTRVTRDVNERNRQPEDVWRQERKFVGPGFFNTIAKSKNGVDIDVLNDPRLDTNKPHPLENAVDDIISALEDKQALIRGCKA